MFKSKLMEKLFQVLEHEEFYTDLADSAQNTEVLRRFERRELKKIV